MSNLVLHTDRAILGWFKNINPTQILLYWAQKAEHLHGEVAGMIGLKNAIIIID